MARIPGYESQDTELPVAPRYSRVQADPQAFGAGLGPAIQHAAEGSAGQFAQEFERERRNNDTIQENLLADESSRQQGAAMLALKRLQGAQALAGVNDVLHGFVVAGDSIAERAQNEDQRKRFKLRWAAQRTELEKYAAAHVIEQNDLLDKSLQERAVATQNERIVENPHGAAEHFFDPDVATSPIAMLDGQLEDYFLRTTGSPDEAANRMRKVREEQALLIVKSMLAKVQETGYGPVQKFITQAGSALGAHLPGLEAEVSARIGATAAQDLGDESNRQALTPQGLVDPVKAKDYFDARSTGFTAENRERGYSQMRHGSVLYRQSAEMKIDALSQEAQRMLVGGDLGTGMSAWRNPEDWTGIGGRPAEVALALRDKEHTYHGPETFRMLVGWWRNRQHGENAARQLPSEDQTARWSHLVDKIARGELTGLPIETFVDQWLRGVDAKGEPLLAEPDYRQALGMYTSKVATKAGAAMPRDSSDQLLVLKAMADMGFKRPEDRKRKPLDLKDIPLDSKFGAVHMEVWSEFQTWRKGHQEATDKEAVEAAREIVRPKAAEKLKTPGWFGTEALGAEVRQRQSLQPSRQEFQPVDSKGEVIVLPPALVVAEAKLIPTQVRDTSGGIVDPRKEIRLHFLKKYRREPTEPEYLLFYNANVQRQVFR